MRASIQHITSRDNPIVKSIMNLARSPSARRADGFCLLEGDHLIVSYVARVGALDTLVVRDDAQHTFSHLTSKASRTVVMSAKLFDGLSSLATPSGVLALARVPGSPTLHRRGFVLALDAVQDPGNVGTLIRTAAAVGVDQVWVSEDSAFVWGTKALRAAQGAHFHTQIAEGVLLRDALPKFDGATYATLPRDTSSIAVQSLFDTTFSNDVLLVVSNEGRGLSPQLISTVTAGISIPMTNAIESLNVSVAGSVALYVIARHARQI
jgi:RNA methyltransferase, TrmH family